MSIEKRDTNLELRKIEKEYRDLYNQSLTAYFTVNAVDGRISNCNQAARKLFNYSKEEMLQMKVFELYADTPHGLPKAQKCFKDFQAGKSIRNVELQVKQRKGDLVWVSLSIEPLMGPDDKPIRSLFVMVDMLDRRRAEIALHKSYKSVLKLVEKRTAELAEAKLELKQKIKERNRAEKALLENAIRLDVLLNATTDLILMLDLEGFVVTANKQACERYSKTLQEFKGLNIFSLMPPDLSESRKKMADTAIRSKQPVCCLEEIEGMFYSSVIYPISDDVGVVRNYSVYVQDVTPFKLAEKRLQNSEKSFRTLAEKANDGIIVIKMDGNIVYVNKRFVKICDYNDLELLKSSINKLIETAEIENLWERVRRRLGENLVPNSFVLNLITKSDRTVPVEVTVSKTIWQGRPAHMMVVRDITAQKQAEAKLRKEQIKLEHSVKSRTKQLVETNIALSVLARNIDQRFEEAQKKTDRKIDSKILPIIENLQKNKVFANYMTELDMLKAHLNELSPHSTGKSGSIYMLTNAELRIASLIKNGFKSPEIARKLCVSQDTVKTHRRNIRNKLDIHNSKINLASYLRAKMR